MGPPSLVEPRFKRVNPGPNSAIGRPIGPFFGTVSPDAIFLFAMELSVDTANSSVPIIFYQLDNIPFRITKENDSTTGDVLK